MCSVLDALPLIDVEDALENARNVLDDLWRHEPPYSKTRVTNLMDVIATDVTRCITKQIININIWKEDFTEISNILQQCLNIGHRWIRSCKELTEIFWPNYSLHLWSGESYVPENLINLTKRLKEVLKVRVIHRQLIRLLTTAEQDGLDAENIFKPFKGLICNLLNSFDLNLMYLFLEIDIMKYGPSVDQPWKSAKKHFEYLLQPAEQRVAVKLKKQLSNVNANTRQVNYFFIFLMYKIMSNILRLAAFT